jgi:hypothetical protein
MKKIMSIILVLVLVLGVGVNSFAMSKENNNSNYAFGFKNKGTLIKYLIKNNVPVEKRKILIKKIENGEVWDSCNPTNLEKVPQDFYKLDPKEESQIKYYRFNDGSFIKIESKLNESKRIDETKESKEFLRKKIKNDKIYKEILSSQYDNTITKKTMSIQPNGVEIGSGYAWYYDYQVDYSTAGLYASMITEFVIVDQGPDYVVPSGFFVDEVYGFGELGMYPTIDIIREEEIEAQSRYALADMYWYANYPLDTPWGGSAASGTHHLYLGVGDDAYHVSPDTPY